MKNRELFLKEVTELSRKHGIGIARGCCGAPSLHEVDGHVRYEAEEDGAHLKLRTVEPKELN